MVDWGVELIRSVGMPIATLAVFGWGVWQVVVWTGREIVLPVRDKVLVSLVALFDRLDATMTAMDEHLGRMAETVERHATVLDRIEETARKTEERVRTEHQFCRSEHCGLQKTLDSIEQHVRRPT